MVTMLVCSRHKSHSPKSSTYWQYTTESCWKNFLLDLKADHQCFCAVYVSVCFTVRQTDIKERVRKAVAGSTELALTHTHTKSIRAVSARESKCQEKVSVQAKNVPTQVCTTTFTDFCRFLSVAFNNISEHTVISKAQLLKNKQNRKKTKIRVESTYRCRLYSLEKSAISWEAIHWKNKSSIK